MSEPPEVNGVSAAVADVPRETVPDEVAVLKQEKAALEAQYRNLVGKLTTMRNTLGDKLKEDADELDRRAQEIEQLREANSSLSFTADTLKQELESLNQDNASLTAELSALRSRVSSESIESETTLREALQDAERLRTENEVLEIQVNKEKVGRDKAETDLNVVQAEFTVLSAELTRTQQELKAEQVSTSNLSSVLEEFQAAKDRELQSTLSDLKEELYSTQQSLATYKKRTHEAEASLQNVSINSKETIALQKDLSEKTVLIGKLRHEAVIANEHLTEALKRLRNSSNDTSVDRRLVTNVLLTFITTPRGDSKRFEMLKLLSTVLQWTDEERERAGLQRSSSTKSTSSNSLSPPNSRRGHTRNNGASIDSEASNESFSNLWVEYLLKESSGPSTSSSSSSPPLSPTSALPPLTLGGLPRLSSANSSVGPLSPTRSSTISRRPSLSSISGVSSTEPSSVTSTSHSTSHLPLTLETPRIASTSKS